MPDKSASTAPVRDPLDHDGDNRKGGSAPPPAINHLVVIKASASRKLAIGEVIAVADTDVKPLLSANIARTATATEVELAQPRVRPWASA